MVDNIKPPMIGKTEEKPCMYEVYTYCKDPVTRLSPWQKFSTDADIMRAQEIAHELHKTKLYERVEIKQRHKANCNEHGSAMNTVKVYKRHMLEKLLNSVF